MTAVSATLGSQLPDLSITARLRENSVTNSLPFESRATQLGYYGPGMTFTGLLSLSGLTETKKGKTPLGTLHGSIHSNNSESYLS